MVTILDFFVRVNSFSFNADMCANRNCKTDILNCLETFLLLKLSYLVDFTLITFIVRAVFTCILQKNIQLMSYYYYVFFTTVSSQFSQNAKLISTVLIYTRANTFEHEGANIRSIF